MSPHLERSAQAGASSAVTLPGGTSASAVALPVKSGLPFEVATATLSTSAAVVGGLGDVALGGEVVSDGEVVSGGGSSC